MSGIIAVGHKHIVSVFNIQKTHHIPANPEHPALFWAAVILRTHLKVQSKFPKLLWSHTWLWSACSYAFTNPIHSLLPDLLGSTSWLLSLSPSGCTHPAQAWWMTLHSLSSSEAGQYEGTKKHLNPYSQEYERPQKQLSTFKVVPINTCTHKKQNASKRHWWATK